MIDDVLMKKVIGMGIMNVKRARGMIVVQKGVMSAIL